MSIASSGSTGTSKAHETGVGIPKTCVCGSYVVAKTSKSDANTYRRYYRCAYANTLQLSGDKHLFRWVEDAIVTEVDALTNAVKRLEAQVKTISKFMEDQERYAREKAQGEVAVQVEEAIVSANRRMLGTIFGVCVGVGVVICLVSVGITKWVG